MNHSHKTSSRFTVTLLAAFLSVAVAAPGFAADKSEKEKKQQQDAEKKGKSGGSKSQSDQAKQSLEKQKQVASGLRDKALSDPTALQAMIDDLKAQLQAEEDRHAAAVATNEAATKAAGADKKAAQKAQKSTSEEGKAYSSRKTQLQRQIADLEKKLAAAGGTPSSTPAPPSTGSSPLPGTPKVSTPK